MVCMCVSAYEYMHVVCVCMGRCMVCMRTVCACTLCVCMRLCVQGGYGNYNWSLFIVLFSALESPQYNHTGWLGVKHSLLTYSPLLSRLTVLMLYVQLFFLFFLFFIVCLKKIHWSGILTVLLGCCMAGAMWNCCCLSTSSVYTIHPCNSLQCHFVQSHICRVHVCLVVTGHLHFWQNDPHLLCATTVTHDLSCATTVTGGWKRYWNKSAHKGDPREENSSHHSCRDCLFVSRWSIKSNFLTYPSLKGGNLWHISLGSYQSTNGLFDFCITTVPNCG